jgi:hypothetical protein
MIEDVCKNFISEEDSSAMYCGPYRQKGDGSQDLVKYCNGRYCMMWRWVSNTKGYCGLAGKPVV